MAVKEDLKSFRQLYEAAVESNPQNLAISDGKTRLSYLDLDRVSGNIASYLSERKIGKGSIVGIYSDRSIEFTAAVLAVFRLGAAYVAIDSSYPQSRVNHIIEDCKITTVLKTDYAGDLVFGNADVYTLDIGLLNKEYHPINSQEQAGNLAYIIYTSGSTGTPKGAMVRYENFLNMICWQKDFYDISAADKTSWIARPGFDASLFELWAYIISGASIHIPEENLLYEPPLLLKWIAEKSLTICFMPTPLAESCLALDFGDDIRLRYLFSGGDALRKRPKPGSKFKMFDHYGPSECTIVSSFAEIKPGDEICAFSNIGKAITGAEMRVLNDDLTQTQMGEVGEIYIGGAGVGSGYLNNQELTNEKFIKDPFSKDKDAKLYKSGDLGALAADGTIEFHGRIDRQVKIRGHRIELGEIESRLLNNPKIKNAAVVASEGGSTQKRIVAFVVPADKSDADFIENTRQRLSEEIASYMLPSLFIELESLPENTNGKIDRLALANMASTGKPQTSEEVQIKTAGKTEQIIADMFKQELGYAIGIDDNFFDCGGDSLKAGKLAGKIRQQFGIEFSVRCIFDNPSIAALSPLIKSADKSDIEHILPIKTDRSAPLPITPSQEQLLFLNQMQEDNSVCNIVTVTDIDGFVDKDTLEGAIGVLARSQELLRGCFVLTDQGFKLLINPEPDCKLDYEDIIRVREDNKQQRLEAIIKNYAHTNFDISTPPLCRFVLIRVEDTHFKLVSVFHHCIADGWSMGVFIRGLLSAYESLAKGISPLPEQLPVQYADYAVWLKDRLKTKQAAKQLNYWKGYLQDAQTKLDLTCANERGKQQTFTGARKCFSFSQSLTQKLEQLGEKNGSTMYMLLLSAYALTLYHFSRQKRFCIGSTAANRIVPEVENIIGLFVNSFVIKFDFEKCNTFGELLADVREASLKALANQNAPFEEVVEALNIKRDPSRHSVFQHLFIFQNAHISQADMCGFKIRFDEVGNDSAKLDIALDALKRDGAIEGWFEYNTPLFNAESISVFCDKFVEIAGNIANDSDSKLEQICFCDMPQTQPQTLQPPPQFEQPCEETAEPAEQGRMYEVELPPSLDAQLKQLSGESKISLLLTAFAGLLYEYGRGNYISLSIKAALYCGRAGEDEKQSARVRLNFEPQKSFADLLETVGKSSKFYAASAQTELTCTQTDNQNLIIRISEADDCVKIIFEYEELFDEQAIALMTEHFIDLLELFMVEPNRAVEQIPIYKPQLTAAALRQDDKFISFIDMFCEQAFDDGYAPAIEDANHCFNYEQLNHISNHLAADLMKHNVANRRLGIHCGQGVEFIICAIAIMKAQASYITLDSRYPIERLRFMADDAALAVVVRTDENLPIISEKIPLIDLNVGELLSREPIANITPDLTGEQTAYSIYTSGSTGKPKGVEISHANLMNLINWQIDYYDIGACDCASQLARPSFDACVSEIFPYLAVGGRVVVADEQIILNPPVLIQWLCDKKITISDMTTPLAEVILFESFPDNCSLRILKTGGDRLHKYPPKGLPFDFYNEYGPTECTVITTAGLIEPQEQPKSLPHIGKPITKTTVYVLDENMQPVEQGAGGELYIGGSSVAKGYINRDDLTKEKFLPDPFSDAPGAVMYRSGDIVRILPEGNIEFIGRSDFQVQIRGFRVELGEIENAILASGKVRAAAVIATGEGQQVRIDAYIVANTADGQTPPGLIGYLKQNLPDYMIPSSFFLLSELPLTQNGKIDRQALEHLAPPTPDSVEQKAKPRNHIEQLLLDIWRQLLQRDDIGIYDDFFDIGGHSILIITMAGMLEKHGFKMRVTKIFEYPKIANLASYLKFGEAHNAATNQDELITLRKGDNKHAPLFFIHTVEGDMLFYSNLIKRMDKSQPCCGILDRGIFDFSKKIKTINDMAEHYTNLILQHRRQGPYMIAGYCFAGFIAFEVARKLKAMGREVGLLALIEVPVVRVSPRYWKYYALRAMHILRFSPTKLIEMLKKQSRLFDVYEIDDGFIFDVWEGVSNDNEFLDNMRKTHSANMAAVRQYDFKPYGGDVVLYTAAKRRMWRSRGKDLGWSSLTRKTQIVEVDAEHKDISLPPYIDTIASDMNKRINELRKRIGKQGI